MSTFQTYNKNEIGTNTPVKQEKNIKHFQQDDDRLIEDCKSAC